MMTSIEWHGETWNPAKRLDLPLRWRKPRMVFVNSMSDLFDDQLDQIFAVMALTPHHTYQVLMNRPGRMLEYFAGDSGNRITSLMLTMDKPSGCYNHPPEWPLPNVWLGVTCENQKAVDERIPLLMETPAAVRFLSCEPLLEEIVFLKHGTICLVCGGSGVHCDPCSWTGYEVEPENLLDEIDWVIVGGESGPGARPCNIAWIRSIVEQCKDADVPCFVEQLEGNNSDEWPEDLRVRQFPVAN